MDIDKLRVMKEGKRPDLETQRRLRKILLDTYLNVEAIQKQDPTALTPAEIADAFLTALDEVGFRVVESDWLRRLVVLAR